LKYDGEAAWSPDGQHIVFTDVNTYGLDDRTYMYDVDTLELVWLVNVGMSSITFSPDGKVIVSSSRIEFWDAATGELIDAPYEGNASLSAAFIPGEDTLLVGRSWVLGFGVDTANTEIGVWDYEQKRLNIIIKNDGGITTFTVSPDGKLLATAFALLPDVDGGHGVFLWDLATNSNRCTFPGVDVAISPTGEIVAIIDNSLAEKGKVLLYDTNTCQLLKTLYQAEYIFGFAYSPDGQMLALVSEPEDTIRLLDAETGQLLYEQSGQWDTVWQLAFSPDGQFLMSRESYGTMEKIHVWKVMTEPKQ
jgi:WD40 repeat protein